MGREWRRMRRLTFVLCLLAACSKKDPRSEPADVITLAVVTGLSGTVAPCGCTSKPLGGVDKLARQIELLREKSPAVGLLVNGDTFVELDDPPAHRFEQERQKAVLLADVFKKLPVLSIVRGPRDLSLHHAV